MKYFTWNFDDGLEQDKRIIKILKERGMGATFNLNSSLFGRKQMIGRIGNLGIKEIPIETYEEDKRTFLKYSSHYRIPKDEIVDVYNGFEIASHTAEHIDLTKCNKEEALAQIAQDQVILGDMFHTEITGFAYPFGRYNKQTLEVLRKRHILYARTASMAKDFDLPKDTLQLPITSWIIKKDAIAKVQEFIDADSEKDQFFLMFAHGYELDFDTKESNFAKFETICDMVAHRKDIVCCSTGEAIRAITGKK